MKPFMLRVLEPSNETCPKVTGFSNVLEALGKWPATAGWVIVHDLKR